MKKLLLILLPIFLLAAGCNKAVKEQPPAETSNSGNLPPPGLPPLPKLPVFSGILKTSDDAAQGNLMVVAQPDQRSYNEITKATRLYIKTQRDYSSLVGKKVLVQAVGGKDSFQLFNIVLDDGQSDSGPFGK